MKFPNKMIEDAYASIDGKVLKMSPSRKVFTDQDGSTEYNNYHAIQWLIDNGWVVRLPYDPSVCFSLQWKRKDQI